MDSVPRIRKKNQVSFIFQGELVKVKVTGRLLDERKNVGGVRRAIYEFSRRSRKHLLDTFARLDTVNVKATFITLTYHNTNPTAHQAKNDLRTFLKRVFRRFGDIPVVWRLELQERGVWHFHLIAMNLPYYHWKDCLSDWQAATGDPTITNVKLEFCYNAKQTRRYVSKYVAKVAASNLDTVANLAADALPGRFWGIENRKNLCFATIAYLFLDQSKAFYDFKRSARCYWSGVNTFKYCGFSLYVENIERWKVLLLNYVEGIASVR